MAATKWHLYHLPNESIFFNHSNSRNRRFLQQAETIDYLELVKSFRQWVRNQIGQST
jgi:hypothetical protein